MRTLLRHGTIVNADGPHRADVLIDGERIAAIGTDLPAEADRVIDATNRVVLPGGVDVHTHLDMPLGDIRTADDFESGTIAAACGGTTTISTATHHMRVDYNPYEGRTLGGAVETVVARGDIIVDRGRFVGAPGRGRFLKRAPFRPRSS